MLDAFSTRTMIAVLDQRREPLTFLRKTFFPGAPRMHESETFDIDVRKGGRRIAPFVSPIREGQVMRREGFRTQSVKPGYLKPKRVITPAECKKRLPGENIFSPRSLQERAGVLLARDLGELDVDCTNREEVMIRDALLNGKIEIWEDVNGTLTKVREVDFLRESALTVTLEGGTWWTTTATTIFDNLQTWCALVLKHGYLSPDTLVVSTDVGNTMVKNSDFLAKLDNRRVEMGSIKPREIAPGVNYIGTIVYPGVYLEIYSDARTYIDESGSEQPMMPARTVLLGSTQAQCEMHYGPIEDFDAAAEVGIEDGIFQVQRFPKTWTDKDPSVRHVLLQTAPLPVPVNVDGFLKATVLEAS